MKVIITGATGFVGAQVLKYALAHPLVTHVVLLQRREHPDLPTSTSKKIETVIHDDFSVYPDALLSRLAGAEAVLWALGGKHDNFPNLATAQRVNVEYTRAAVAAFERGLIPHVPAGKKFRFVLCSGKSAVWDQTATLWFLPDTRKMKGAAEATVFAMAKAHPERVEAYACRPAIVVSENPGWVESIHGFVAPSVKVMELGAVMVKLGADGSEERFWEFGMIKKLGKDIVAERDLNSKTVNR